MNQQDAQSLFEELGPFIDALITNRIVQFHQALVERGQIKPIPKQFGGPIVDCTADQAKPSSQPQSPSEHPDRR
ncbi:MAG: hypothetical protein WA993_00330 [Candidatus Binatus sp.]|jgi:hypothetical protein